MKVHFEKCDVCHATFTEKSVKIMHKNYSLPKLLALNTLYIDGIKPQQLLKVIPIRLRNYCRYFSIHPFLIKFQRFFGIFFKNSKKIYLVIIKTIDLMYSL